MNKTHLKNLRYFSIKDIISEMIWILFNFANGVTVKKNQEHSTNKNSKCKTEYMPEVNVVGVQVEVELRRELDIWVRCALARALRRRTARRPRGVIRWSVSGSWRRSGETR